MSIIIHTSPFVMITATNLRFGCLLFSNTPRIVNTALSRGFPLLRLRSSRCTSFSAVFPLRATFTCVLDSEIQSRSYNNTGELKSYTLHLRENRTFALFSLIHMFSLCFRIACNAVSTHNVVVLYRGRRFAV